MSMATDTGHVTYVEGPDSAGHWGWYCAGPYCQMEGASGYELAAEVIGAATVHGPLAADSLVPVDDPDNEW